MTASPLFFPSFSPLFLSETLRKHYKPLREVLFLTPYFPEHLPVELLVAGGKLVITTLKSRITLTQGL